MIGENLKRRFFTQWFPHWSPDVALRYYPVVQWIRADPQIKSVLDVGSGGLGITPYLKRPVTGADVTFPLPHSRLLKQVLARADQLPFDDQSFDAVICVDVLEHIPPAQRQQVMCELLRVARRCVCIVVPCGAAAEKEDQFFAKRTRQKKGRPDPYLQEHLTYGVPTKKNIRHMIPAFYTVKTKGNVSWWLHRMLLILQYSNNRVLRFLSSVVCVLLVPIFARINLPPTYRQAFFIRK